MPGPSTHKEAPGAFRLHLALSLCNYRGIPADHNGLTVQPVGGGVPAGASNIGA